MQVVHSHHLLRALPWSYEVYVDAAAAHSYDHSYLPPEAGGAMAELPTPSYSTSGTNCEASTSVASYTPMTRKIVNSPPFWEYPKLASLPLPFSGGSSCPKRSVCIKPASSVTIIESSPRGFRPLLGTSVHALIPSQGPLASFNDGIVKNVAADLRSCIVLVQNGYNVCRPGRYERSSLPTAHDGDSIASVENARFCTPQMGVDSGHALQLWSKHHAVAAQQFPRSLFHALKRDPNFLVKEPESLWVGYRGKSCYGTRDDTIVAKHYRRVCSRRKNTQYESSEQREARLKRQREQKRRERANESPARRAIRLEKERIRKRLKKMQRQQQERK